MMILSILSFDNTACLCGRNQFCTVHCTPFTNACFDIYLKHIYLYFQIQAAAYQPSNVKYAIHTSQPAPNSYPHNVSPAAQASPSNLMTAPAPNNNYMYFPNPHHVQVSTALSTRCLLFNLSKNIF